MTIYVVHYFKEGRGKGSNPLTFEDATEVWEAVNIEGSIAWHENEEELRNCLKAMTCGEGKNHEVLTVSIEEVPTEFINEDRCWFPHYI